MLSKVVRWFEKKEEIEETLLIGQIPKHVAIIMDGNGRWAKQRGLPRVAGHRSGMKTVKEITKAASNIGVEILTLYAFSTENWKRPKDEVDFLMQLPTEFLRYELEELIENNVQVRMMGYQDQLPQHTLDAMTTAIRETEHNTGLVLNFALNYGSRREMVQAIKEIGSLVSTGEITIEQINEQLVEDHLLSHSFGDPDLLIRTSGEVRLSNFMLWQVAYTEFWFCDSYWPDFNKDHFYEAIREYQKRIRRYGAV